MSRARNARAVIAAALLAAMVAFALRIPHSELRNQELALPIRIPHPEIRNQRPPPDLAAQPADDLIAALTRLDALASADADADAAFLFDAYSAALDRALDGKNFDTVRAILETTPRADVRALLLAAFADVWARTAPAEAAAWVAGSTPLAPDRARVLSGVMTTWAARDPAAAAAFAEALPPGDARRAALESVALQWRGSDFAAAAAWVSDHTPHADFDSALAALATDPRLVSVDPAAAIGWAERIADAETRREAIATIARQWAVSDATGQTGVGISPDPRRQTQDPKSDSSLSLAQRAWLNEILVARKRDGGS